MLCSAAAANPALAAVAVAGLLSMHPLAYRAVVLDRHIEDGGAGLVGGQGGISSADRNAARMIVLV